MGSNDPLDYGFTLPVAMVIASFTTIAWVNTIELQCRIWLSFKRYTGLYFWSLLLSSWGCAIHPLGFLLLNFRILKNAHVAGGIIGIGWWWMVTGQALVLYSRLYLVVRNHYKIRWVLVMIITNVFILHIPITLLSQIGYSTLPSAANWLKVYRVYEKVQMTVFTLQEFIISGLYLWETRRLLRPGRRFKEEKTRQVMYHLLWVNIFIIFLDMALLATEYANLFFIQTVFKAAIYSIKLRLEFVVLNQLMELVKRPTVTYELSRTRSNKSSSARDALESMHDKTPAEATATTWVPPNLHTYSVSASAPKDVDFETNGPGPLGVVRTTEVFVHDDPNPTSGPDEIGPGPPHHQHHPRHPGSGGPREAIARLPSVRFSRVSPSSSEMDFAQKGA